MVKSRFGIGCQECKDGREELGLDGEGHGLFKDRRVILIKSKDERPTDGNAKVMEGLNDFTILRRVVLKFSGSPQVYFRKRFKTDKKAFASALGQQFHIFDLLQSGLRGLSKPFLLKGD